MVPDVGQFVQLIAGVASAAPAGRVLRYGAVQSVSGGRPIVLFDGESTPTAAGLPVLGSYAPVAGDRVAILPDGPAYLVLGKVT